MKRFLYVLLGIILVIVIAFFSYDYYMRNSGWENRIEYENQKDDMGVDYGNRPIDDMLENHRDRKDARKEKRRKKREQRRSNN